VRTLSVRASSQYTVLLVEDDALVREAVEPALEAAGSPCWSAADGNAAKEMLRARRVDIVLSDVVIAGRHERRRARRVREGAPSRRARRPGDRIFRRGAGVCRSASAAQAVTTSAPAIRVLHEEMRKRPRAGRQVPPPQGARAR